MSSSAAALPPTDDYADVAPNVCVRTPYYALEGLRAAGGRATAVVPVQTPAGRQAHGIGLAEVGRHLANLGLCAASTVYPAAGRHYYLAHQADGRMHAAERPAPGPLRGSAVVTDVARSRATVRTELHDGAGDLVAHMEVRYQVMNAAVFRRLMGAATEPDVELPGNPYTMPTVLADIVVDDGAATARLPVEAAMCRGHFAGFPALPVSVAGHAAFSLFDHVVAHTHGPAARWRAGTFRIQADHLVAAGQTTDVSVEPTTPHDGATAFAGTIRVHDRTAFQVWVDYEIQLP